MWVSHTLFKSLDHECELLLAQIGVGGCKTTEEEVTTPERCGSCRALFETCLNFI